MGFRTMADEHALIAKVNAELLREEIRSTKNPKTIRKLAETCDWAYQNHNLLKEAILFFTEEQDKPLLDLVVQHSQQSLKQETPWLALSCLDHCIDINHIHLTSLIPLFNDLPPVDKLTLLIRCYHTESEFRRQYPYLKQLLKYSDDVFAESTSVYIPKFEEIRVQMQRDTLQQEIDQLNVDFSPGAKRKI